MRLNVSRGDIRGNATSCSRDITTKTDPVLALDLNRSPGDRFPFFSPEQGAVRRARAVDVARSMRTASRLRDASLESIIHCEIERYVPLTGTDSSIDKERIKQPSALS